MRNTVTQIIVVSMSNCRTNDYPFSKSFKTYIGPTVRLSRLGKLEPLATEH